MILTSATHMYYLPLTEGRGVGGHIASGANPVGISGDLASCLHSTS